MKNHFLLLLMLLLAAGAIGQKRYTPALSREEVLNQEYCTGLFATRDGVYFDMEADAAAFGAAAYFNVLDWLQGRVSWPSDLHVPKYANSGYPQHGCSRVCERNAG